MKDLKAVAKPNMRKPPASREKMLVAAELIIVSEGLQRLTARYLSAKSGVNTSLIVYNFGGLDGLIEQLLNANIAKTRAMRADLIGRLPRKGVTLDAALGAILRPILHPPVYCGKGYSSTVVSQIYANANAGVKAKATEALTADLEPVIRFVQPFVKHLGEDTLLWRLSYLFSASMSMVPGTSVWDVFSHLGQDMHDKERCTRELINFAAGALMAG